MRLFTGSRQRLRALFLREQQERQLDEEVRFHLVMETEVALGARPSEISRLVQLNGLRLSVFGIVIGMV